MTIRNRFIAASIAIVALVTGLILFLITAQKNLESQMKEIIQKNLAGMRAAEQIKYHFVLYDDLVFRYLATEDRGLLSEAVASIEKAREWIKTMKNIVEGDTEKE